MSRNASASIRLIVITLAAGLGSASIAHAEASNECRAWTWFPDFTCENRVARPEGAINPVGMPYLFEDPYITTGLNFAYIYHRLPEDGALGRAFDGGGAHVLALQIRLALTDRLAFIATKDGLTMLRPGDASVVDEDTGIMDMTFGFKYALFESDDRNFILTPALRYEIPMGSRSLFQNFGDGVFIPSASFRWGLGPLGIERANLVASLGGQVPVDSDANAQSLFYNIHLDYGFEIEEGVVKSIVPFIEFNGIHYTKSGDGTNPVYLRGGGGASLPLSTAQSKAQAGTGPFEGFDVANLGSTGIAGADVLVMGGGVRVPTTWGVSFALMYEGPLTSRADIHNQRFTFMATWEL